uniref:Uncharacterized protein n=1 Tax=viral metagenome TaxID=1070528 RepID=A0A6M3X7W7_9ZZZZ
MKRDDVLTIGGVILGLTGAFLLGRSRVAKAADEDIEEGAEELKALDPTLTDEEAKAAAAATLAAEALLRAQQAEAQAQLDALAALVSQAEQVLATAQSEAILHPEDTAAILAAEQAEAQAQADREELEREWTNALNSATTEVQTAERAAEVAVGAYLAATRNVGIWEDTLKRDEVLLRDALDKFGVSIYEPHIPLEPEERERLARLITNLQTFIIPEDRANIEKWRHIEMRTKTDANAAITSANLIVERVLTLTADVRLLGILLALAYRTDGIAIAVRTKLGELQAKIID